jgi:dTDP-4-dehydrorhamnose reductase
MSGPACQLDRTASARWVVLGAAGQLGRALLSTLPREGRRVIGIRHEDLDISDRLTVLDTLAALRPDLVINAAAYTAVDQAESEPARAFAVNRDGAANVAEACFSIGVPMVQVSTDYVFDGRKKGPYREDDEPLPLSVYGLSKAEGERLIRDRHPRRHAIIRTSWLFGLHGRNFVKTIVAAAHERHELRVVADQRGCPTPADDLADAIFAVGEAMRVDRTLSGTFHFAGAEAISWHGFADAIVSEIAPHLSRRPRIIPIATKDYPRGAPRPHNSLLDCRKLAQLGIGQKSWRPALSFVLDEILGNDGDRLVSQSRSRSCPIFS